MNTGDTADDAPDRPLKRGWTTGTCAAGAAKAAFAALVTGAFPDPVEVELPSAPAGPSPSPCTNAARRAPPPAS